MVFLVVVDVGSKVVMIVIDDGGIGSSTTLVLCGGGDIHSLIGWTH